MEYPQIDLYKFLTESELQHYYNAIKNELKITNATQFKYATDEDLKNIGLSRPEIRRLRKFYEKYFPHGYLSKIKRLLQAPTSIVKRDDGNSNSTQLANQSPEVQSTNKTVQSPSKAPNNKHIIPADSISVNKQLGTGEFGIVQQGVWTNGTERIQVAIKCLCRQRMQSNPMEFLKEAAIMHSIEHENIVRLYGVVLDTDSLMLVTELAHLRSLLECLKDSGLRVSFLTIPTLCEFAMQICNGMRYLENKRLIHRDLAARNILVFSKNKVKISDFGLSRALGVGKDYYKTNFNVNLKLPIAWCAPESINYLRFTNASDVWAYGVCLWEMFSYGFQPWPALTGMQILEAIDGPNYQRLEQPDCCPQEYYTLMMKCWQDDAMKRPKFSEIYEILPDMKPEQLKAVVNNCESKKDHLEYRQGDIITVLDRNTGTPFWKGVLVSGKTGFFNPSNTVAYLEGLPTINRDSFCRVSERSSKRKLRTEMISKPQNDLKHTGHVGIDGASFGDVAFLGNSQNYNHVPRQIVTPYKPSEDIEQTPLLLPPTPTSPDSLQTASGYFPDGTNVTSLNPTFISSAENTPKNFSNTSQSSFEFPGQQIGLGPTVNVSTNPFASKNDEKVNMTAAFAMQNNQYSNDTKIFANEIDILASSQAGISGRPSSRSNSEDPHVYHEISDDEMVADKLDFGPSLLAEINSMFGSMSATTSQPKSPDFEHVNMKNEFTEISSKLVRKNSAGDANGNKFGIGSMKKKTAGTVKPISVKDEKILNQAIEIANEMSARSMIDLGADPAASAQSPKRKFSFRFPHLSNNGSNDKSNSNGSPNHAGGGVNNGLQTGISSPYSKKKNFTEELKSIPDLQRFRSLNEIKNYNNADIRIPLFDKKSSDFCFEKSREILTRPLSFDPPPALSNTTTSEKKRDRKSISENIMDIENTLKALNQDFMYTYTELNKTDSDETILNEQFSSIVSSIDEEISSATGSLRSAVYNYSNGVQTMFDFNAATNHIDKHLQYMSAQSQNQSVCDTTLDQKLIEDKRSSTPDTGFASRDTNISLSRRSSQKSSYSPQENFFNPKDLHIASSGYTGLREENTLSSERFCTKYNALSASPVKNAENISNNSVYSPRELKIDTEQFKNKSYRQRSMSFTDHFNPISPVMSEPQQRVKRQSTNTKNSQSNSNGQQSRRSASYKPRSIRARTLRRLSYNPIILDSSSTSDEESDCNRSVARSECDIRTRVSVLYRRRRQGVGHKTLSSCNDEHEAIIASNKLYGSNASIKSAPHYNYGGRSMGSYRNYPRNMFDQLAYEDKIYDFGGRGPGNNYGVTAIANQNIIKPPKTFTVNGSCAGSGSGSSSTTSTAAPFSASTRSAIFHEFDVSRLTGKSPTSNFVNSSPEERNSRQSKGPSATPPTTLPLPLLNLTTNANTANTSKLQTEFHWPEKIHGSTVKQNDMFWRQQQRDVDVQSAFLRNLQTVDHIHTSDSSSTDSGEEFVYRSEFIPHVPPSPAP